MIDSRLRQREEPIRLLRWVKAARGEECTIQHPEHCVRGTETTVAAHGNWDKPVGGKVDDTMIAFACWGCHNWLDRTRDPDRLAMWVRGHRRTLRRLHERGLLG